MIKIVYLIKRKQFDDDLEECHNLFKKKIQPVIFKRNDVITLGGLAYHFSRIREIFEESGYCSLKNPKKNVIRILTEPRKVETINNEITLEEVEKQIYYEKEKHSIVEVKDRWGNELNQNHFPREGPITIEVERR